MNATDTGAVTRRRAGAADGRWHTLVTAVVWIAVAVLVGSGLETLRAPGGILDGTRPAAEIIWAIVAVAIVIPSAVTLTIARVAAPLVAALALAHVVDDPGPMQITGIGVALVALGLVWSAPLGAHHIQAGAYGAERRFPLRPPVGYLIASCIAWLIVVGLAAIAVRSSSTIGGIAAGLGSLTLAVGSAPRWHRLARRGLVLVPTGLVVHDPLVLSETLMLRRSEVAGLALASDDSPADLSAGVRGPALELATRDTVTVVLAPGPRRPGGRALHLTAARVAPTRPGAVLRAWDQRTATPPPSTHRSSTS